jgi:hypothetical protein
VLIARAAFEAVISPIHGSLPTDAEALSRAAKLFEAYILGLRDYDSLISKVGATTVDGKRDLLLLATRHLDESGNEVAVIDFAD